MVRDILVTMRKLVPHSGDRHHAEGNSDAHIKLGTWQKICLCKFDGPRTGKPWIKWLGAQLRRT